MYEEIVKKLSRDSKKIIHVHLSSAHVEHVESVAQYLSDPKSIIQKDIELPPPKKDNIKKKTPIIKSTSNNNFPTKRVDFDDDIPWL